MTEINTDRLRISPMSIEELGELVNQYKDSEPGLSQAYGEMLDSCRRHQDRQIWYTSWQIRRKEDETVIGYAGFKGLGKKSNVEIGYGVDEEYEGKGYATEAVNGLCNWAFATGMVTRIEAETEEDNAASQTVLQKNGFTASGENGQEGPRFVLNGGANGQILFRGL